MNKRFKNHWIRLMWSLRKLCRKQKKPQKANPDPEQKNPSEAPTIQLPARRKNSLWKFLFKLMISLSQLFRLIRLLINLIRKSLDSSGKS